jgi:hypothetical protein
MPHFLCSKLSFTSFPAFQLLLLTNYHEFKQFDVSDVSQTSSSTRSVKTGALAKNGRLNTARVSEMHGTGKGMSQSGRLSLQ